MLILKLYTIILGPNWLICKSAVIQCSSWEPGFSYQHPHSSSQPSSNRKWPDVLLLASTESRMLTHVYMQQNTHTHKIKYCFYKSKKEKGNKFCLFLSPNAELGHNSPSSYKSWDHLCIHSSLPLKFPFPWLVSTSPSLSLSYVLWDSLPFTLLLIISETSMLPLLAGPLQILHLHHQPLRS